MDNEESLTSHLTELRTRVIQTFIFVFLGTLMSWVFSERIFDFIRLPISPYLPNGEGGLIFTAPLDKFLAHIKVSILSGIIVSCPFWLYQVWRFIAPGLYASEKKYASLFIISGSFLFLLGVSFVYLFVYPIAFEFLMNFGGTTDQPMITISDYLSFFITTTLLFGAAFELPLILVILGIMGIIDQEFLKQKRRYAIVLIAFLSALMTPPDIISMCMMIVPLYFLYEISIIVVGLTTGKSDQQDS